MKIKMIDNFVKNKKLFILHYLTDNSGNQRLLHVRNEKKVDIYSVLHLLNSLPGNRNKKRICCSVISSPTKTINIRYLFTPQSPFERKQPQQQSQRRICIPLVLCGNSRSYKRDTTITRNPVQLSSIPSVAICSHSFVLP